MSDGIRYLFIDLPATTGGVRTESAVGGMSVTYAKARELRPFPPDLMLVIAPLFAPRFDAHDLIDLLGAKGYQGTLRVLAPDLPNCGGILRELRAHAMRKGIVVEMETMV